MCPASSPVYGYLELSRGGVWRARERPGSVWESLRWPPVATPRLALQGGPGMWSGASMSRAHLQTCRPKLPSHELTPTSRFMPPHLSAGLTCFFFFFFFCLFHFSTMFSLSPRGDHGFTPTKVSLIQRLHFKTI